MEDKLKELKTLLQYLIGHNQDHAAELEELAQKARQLGSGQSYEYLKKGVEELKQSNESLNKAYELL